LAASCWPKRLPNEEDAEDGHNEPDRASAYTPTNPSALHPASGGLE
jgi:hypothetical protein